MTIMLLQREGLEQEDTMVSSRGGGGKAPSVAGSNQSKLKRERTDLSMASRTSVKAT